MKAKSVSLTAGVVQTVSLNVATMRDPTVRVANRTTTGEVWWTLSSGTATTPTVAGDDVRWLPAAIADDSVTLEGDIDTVEVKLLADGGAASVTVFVDP